MDLGLEPHLLSDTLLHQVFGVVERHRDRVNLAAIRPAVNWRQTHQLVESESGRA